jgi:SAM-dependent methyltransferase
VPLTATGARELVHAPGSMLAALAVGSPLLGVALGALGGALAYAAARMRRAPRDVDAFDGAAERTAERYRRASKRRGDAYYVRAKLASDISARAIAARAPLGETLDLGCGRGQLAIVLVEAGAATRVRGVDWDEAKVALATRASEGLDARFEHGDARRFEGEHADTVLLVDMLHYVSVAEQDALLARAAEHVRPGGRLFVREATTGHGLRSWLTLAFERIGTAARFNRGERVRFRDVAREVVPVLEAKGLTCTVEPCSSGTPFANVLVVARRPPIG